YRHDPNNPFTSVLKTKEGTARTRLPEPSPKGSLCSRSGTFRCAASCFAALFSFPARSAIVRPQISGRRLRTPPVVPALGGDWIAAVSRSYLLLGSPEFQAQAWLRRSE